MKYICVLLTLIIGLNSMTALSAPIQVSRFIQGTQSPSVQLLVPGLKDLKFASFYRNGYTYFVFQNSELSLAPDSLKGTPLVQLPHGQALILRGVFNRDTLPSFSTQGNLLRIRMDKKEDGPKSLFKVERVPNGILLPIPESTPIEFQDPNTLEDLIVFPLPYIPLFMEKAFHTPEFTIIPTYQGIGLYPKTSDVKLEAERGGYIIRPQNSKSLNLFKQKPDVTELIFEPLSAPDAFLEISRLQSFLRFASPRRQAQIKTEMARLYLQQGFPERTLETLGSLPFAPTVQAMKFIAFIQLQRNQEALNVWPTIPQPDKTLILWLNGIDKAPLYPVATFESVDLPAALETLFWQNIATKAIAQNNFLALAMATNKLQSTTNPYTNAENTYLQAQIAKAENNDEQTDALLKQIAMGSLSNISAKAQMELTLRAEHAQKITRDEATAALEKIKPLICQTPQEATLLENLSTLYDEQNRPLLALQTDRQLLSVTQDARILNRMQRRFERFFLTNHTGDPVRHILIYYQFKELMPTGAKAIAVKEHIIHDLLALNLLEEAYPMVLELASSPYESERNKMAVQAYLIAKLLEDTDKINTAQKLLKNKKITPELIKDLHPVLQSAINL